MMCLVRLNNTMKRLLMSMAIIISLMIPVKANSEIDPNYDWDNDVIYQSLAEDFRTYTVCQSIHQNLARFVTINYGVGSNLGYPAEWLEQQRSLLSNILAQDSIFADKIVLVITELMQKYNFEYQTLDFQLRENQTKTTQSIIIAISMSIEDPSKSTLVIKGLLTESQRCRSYESKYIYE